MGDQRFLGTWKLVSMVRNAPDGRISRQFGDKPLGYISYLNDGFMFAILMKSNRAPVKISPDELNYAARSIKIMYKWKYLRAVINYFRAATAFVSYCGTYEIKGGTVVHHVKASLIPDWIGTDLEREYKFSGKTMTLSARDYQGGVLELLWERAS